MVSLEETIRAHGHPSLLGTHNSTLEITKEENLTPKGDCIIAVGADKGARDLSAALKELMKDEDSKVSLTLKAGSLEEVIHGRGHPGLTFENPRCMVFRKSGYICDKTVMVHADKAAASLSRDLIGLLRRDETRLRISLEVITSALKAKYLDQGPNKRGPPALFEQPNIREGISPHLCASASS